jgi:hypothetical protein
MNMNSRSIRARGVGPSTPLHDQALPGTGTMPSDRKVGRRDANAEEPQPREREQNNASGRQYILTLPAGEYRGEDDEQAGLTHVHRRDGAGRSQHVCSLPHDNYEIEHDASGSHVYRVPDEEAREPEERRGEEERDLAMGPGAHLPPRASGVGRGRDDLTEHQRLRLFQQRLNAHYGRYKDWLHNRSTER